MSSDSGFVLAGKLHLSRHSRLRPGIYAAMDSRSQPGMTSRGALTRNDNNKRYDLNSDKPNKYVA